MLNVPQGPSLTVGVAHGKEMHQFQIDSLLRAKYLGILYGHSFAELAPDSAEAVAYFADGDLGLDAIEYSRE